MALGFLAPWFFGGAALLIVPWLIHRIRKPERKPVRFSSLMFVPDIRRDVVRRRKIQHPLLMLLRMLLLLVLAFAFTRPYKDIPAAAAVASRPLTRNVILLDVSMSMRAQGLFEAARAEALKLIGQMGSGDRVAVVAFASLPRIAAPLGDPGHAELGSPGRAREAVAAAQPTWERTSYLPALETAEDLLKPFENAQGGEQSRLIVHLITDFQHSGMPEEAPAWKLAPGIELHAIEVGATDVPNAPSAPNASVTDLAIEETKQHQLRIRGKVKNWSMPADKPIAVKLVLDGKEIESKSVTVKQGNATQVIFTTPWNGSQIVAGNLGTGPDALAADDKTFFTWNPLEKRRVVLVADVATTATTATQALKPEPWIGAKFVQLSIPPGSDLPWSLRAVSPDALAGVLAKPDDAPEIVVLGQPESIQADAARELHAYLQRGGNALVLLNGRIDAAALNQGALAGAKMTVSEPRYKIANESTFATIGWVDLDHRIFVPFRGSQYNDFSPLHFYNYRQVALAAGTDAPRVLAKFDDDLPAIVEAPFGKGRIVLWAFGLDPEWTNLPKKASFVPLLHETLAYMTRATEKTFTHRVGETVAGAPDAFIDRGAVQLQAPGESEWRNADQAAAMVLSQPGFLRWKGVSAEQIDAVNTDPRESDPLRIPVSEFRLRLCSSAPRNPVNDQRLAVEPGLLDVPMVKREYGHPFIGMLLALLLLEGVYATTLALANNKKAEAS